MRPWQRLVLSVLVSALVTFLIPKEQLSTLLICMISWMVFAFVFNLTDWIVLFTRPIHHIKKVAREDDGSKAFVFFMILVSSFASMFTVLLLLLSDEAHILGRLVYILVTVGGMLLSWIMVHTLFTFHYAHRYYDEELSDRNRNTAKGLDFPGDDEPDYLDFAYFSFVVGCTFQVSDVQVISKKIRKMVFVHGLISFALNTFVVALTINLIAGLNK